MTLASARWGCLHSALCTLALTLWPQYTETHYQLQWPDSLGVLLLCQREKRKHMTWRKLGTWISDSTLIFLSNTTCGFPSQVSFQICRPYSISEEFSHLPHHSKTVSPHWLHFLSTHSLLNPSQSGFYFYQAPKMALSITTNNLIVKRNSGLFSVVIL